MPEQLPAKLKTDLETFAKLCALANIQLGAGAPGIAILGGVRSMHKLLGELIPQLEAQPELLVRVNNRIGDNMADFLAENLAPPAPDHLPDDWA